MSDLNHIQLPASLIAEIYKNHLVEKDRPKPSHRQPAQPEKVVTERTAAAIQYLGQNQKAICLLVCYPNDVHIPDNQLNFLTSILQACKLNLGDVAIVNCHQQAVSIQALSQELGCRVLLIFGVACSSIALPEFPLFSIQTVETCEVVCSPAVDNLNNGTAASKLLKSRLWTCLKQLFAV